MKMQYTEEQIARANQTDLVSFLNAQGEQLVKSGREYRWKKHDSVTISGNRWYRHSQSKGGYPVDFVMEFYYATFPEAVKILIGEEGEGRQKNWCQCCVMKTLNRPVWNGCGFLIFHLEN